MTNTTYSSLYTASTNTIEAAAIELSITSIVVLSTLYIIVCVIGLVGNGLVLGIMHISVGQKSITDIYVTNLAVADFIFVLMLPFWTVDMALERRWIFGKPMCKLASACTYVHMYAGVFFITAMSVDRLIAIVYFSTCKRSKRMALVTSTVIWLTSGALSVLPFYFRGVKESTSGVTRCDWTFGEDNDIWVVVLFFCRSGIGYFLPMLVIIFCYITIIAFLKSKKPLSTETSKRKDRATLLILVVIAVFLGCWLPNQVSTAIYYLQGLHVTDQPNTSSEAYYNFHMFSLTLAWSHSCVNPVLYAFMRHDIRAKMKETLHATCMKVQKADGQGKVETEVYQDTERGNRLMDRSPILMRVLRPRTPINDEGRIKLENFLLINDHKF